MTLVSSALDAKRGIPHDGALRALFIGHCAPAVFGSVRKVMRAAFVVEGMSRKLDVDQHAVLLLGTLVYSFAGLDVAQFLKGSSFDEA